MVKTRSRLATCRQQGTTLIEVLIAVVVLSVGLLALARLQVTLHATEMEAYQRAQAIILLEDMISRISNNRAHAAGYVTGASSPIGGSTCSAMPSTPTTLQRDVVEWCNALRGAGELAGGGAGVGAMVGGRGCVESLSNNRYLVTVAWQGLAPASAPPSGVACAAGSYDNGTNCTGDLCRRTVTAIVGIGAL